MKKHIMGWMLAVLALAGINLQAQSDEAVFNTTIKQVDMGGVYLNYINEMEIGKGFREIADSILKLKALENNLEADQLDLIKAGVNIGLRLIGLEAYKAQAISGKSEQEQFGSPMYFYKTFLYTGAEPQGIFFDVVPRTNKPFTMLPKVPSNACLAFGGHITMEEAWNKIVREFSKETNPQIKGIPQMLEMAFEQNFQLKLADLLKSINGEYFTVVTSSGTPEKPVFQIMITVPDKNGTLGNLIKKNLPAEFIKLSETAFMVPRMPDFPEWFAPQILLEDTQIIVVSNANILSTVQALKEDGSMIKTSGDFVKGIPQEGLAYFYLNINKQMVDALGNNLGSEEISEILNLLPLPRLFGTSFISAEGYNAYFRSNISYIQFQTLAPISYMAGTLAPALNSAREKARRVSCTSNLKQIGLAQKQYALDHQDKYPPSLQDLINKEYLTDKQVYICPSTDMTTGMSYYYIPGFVDGKDRPDLPVAFDKPGNHKDYVNVLFLDGHVESIPVPGYTEPENVISAIAQKYNYSPEVMVDLLERCKKMQ